MLCILSFSSPRSPQPPPNKDAMVTQMNIVQEEERCLTFHYVRKEKEHARVVLVWG